MTAVGFVLAAITMLVGLGAKLVLRLEDSILGVKEGMRRDLGQEYYRFARYRGGETVVDDQLRRNSRSLARLHCRCHEDLVLIRTAENASRMLIPVVILSSSMGFASASYAYACLQDTSRLAQGLVGLGIPFSAFVLELLFLGYLLRQDKGIRRATESYEKADL